VVALHPNSSLLELIPCIRFSRLFVTATPEILRDRTISPVVGPPDQRRIFEEIGVRRREARIFEVLGLEGLSWPSKEVSPADKVRSAVGNFHTS
jgi:hypothetical protein